jgi:hypothetical protein
MKEFAMNQNVKISGGKSAARHRNGRVFRRSLTPTLALLAALALGLVVPAAAGAQTNFTIDGGAGGGGGGGAGNKPSTGPGAGGLNGTGSASPAHDGTVGSEGAGGKGGDGVGNPGSGILAGMVENGGAGGRGADYGRTEYSNVRYDGNIIVTGGKGGQGGQGGTGASTPSLPEDPEPFWGNGGQGGAGGDAVFTGAANVVTTITGSLAAVGGATGTNGISPAGGGAGQGVSGAGGRGGMVRINHAGTVKFEGAGPHDLIFTNASGVTGGGYMDVFINNLLLDGNSATINTTGLGGTDKIYLGTLSLSNAATFQAAGGSNYVMPLPTSGKGYTFTDLHISGTGNRLDLNGSIYTPGAVNGKLIFDVANVAGGTMLDANNDINLTGFSMDNLLMQGDTAALAEGQSITLMANVTGVIDPQKTFAYKGGMRIEEFSTQISGNALVANFGGASQAVRTGQVFHPYFQGQLAAMQTVSGATRPAMEESIRALANTATNVGTPLVSLAAVGSSTTLETGSEVEMESFGGALSVGTKMANTGGVTTVAAFGEFGTGSYDTSTDIADLSAWRDGNYGVFIGGGDTEYAGGGVFLHHLFDATQFAGGFSLEGSLRMGTVNNQFNMDILDRSGYDIDRLYWGGHVGAGYNMPLNNLNSVDFFGQVHLTSVESGSIQSTAGQEIAFDSVTSTVSRLGGRYNHNFNELIKGYATAAWEYEFDGESGGSVDNIRVQDSPSLKGSSGFGQLGVNVKSASNPVSLDLSVFGVIGQQEGFGGTAGLKLDF